MSTALTRFTAQRAESAPVPMTVEDAIKVGGLMRIFDQDGNEANAIAKVLAGQELGLGPMASIRGIHMIKGKPSLSAEMLASLIKRSGRYDFRSKVSATEATVTIYDRGEALEPVTFTMKDAETAGLVAGNANYKKFPGDMLFTKAIIRAVRRHCPEVGGGAVYMEDGEIEPAPPATFAASADAEGEVIEGTAEDAPVEEWRARWAELQERAAAEDVSLELLKAGLRASEIASPADLADDETWNRALAVIGHAEPQSEQLFDTPEAPQREPEDR